MVSTAVYRFGETSLVFESTDGTWLDLLARRFHAFRNDADTPGFVVRFECSQEPKPRGMSSPFATYLEKPHIEPGPCGFTAVTRTVVADVDLGARRAHLRGPCALYPLDNLLRYLLPALHEQGVLLHAAALEGLVACGPSGAGKSTLARLVGEHALSDELCAVRRTPDGRFRVTSLPFWRARPGSAELRALLFLRHGEAHRLERLSTSEALKRLTTQILWPIALDDAMEALLTRVALLIERVPAFELAFSPSADVWEYIQEQVTP